MSSYLTTSDVAQRLNVSLDTVRRWELVLAWSNLVEIVRETVSIQQDLAPQRVFDLTLPADELVGVMADEQRIRQALTNYLINAHGIRLPIIPSR